MRSGKVFLMVLTSFDELKPEEFQLFLFSELMWQEHVDLKHKFAQNFTQF